MEASRRGNPLGLDVEKGHKGGDFGLGFEGFCGSEAETRDLRVGEVPWCAGAGVAKGKFWPGPCRLCSKPPVALYPAKSDPKVLTTRGGAVRPARPGLRAVGCSSGLVLCVP